jgi:tetratricopeptide (TPR) repeat protein
MIDPVSLADALLSEQEVTLSRVDSATLAGALGEISRHLGDHPARAAQAVARVEELAAASSLHGLAARAKYVRAQAIAASGDLATALVVIDEAAHDLGAAGMHGAALRTNLGRAHVLNETGRHPEALGACDHILHVLATHPPSDLNGDAALELQAAAEQNRGLCFELTGRWLQALEAYAHAEAVYSRLGDTASIGEILNNRGLVLLALGRIAEAQGAFRDAIAMLDEDDRPLRALAMNGLAETLLARGEYVACLATLADAKSLLSDIDAPMPELDRSLGAARAYEALNLHREALATYEEAAEFLGLGALAVEAARASWGAARIRLAMGDAQRAAHELAGVLETFRQAGHGQWLALALLDRAATARILGAADEALVDARMAASISRDADARLELVRAELVVAELCEESGDVDAADRALSAAAEAMLDIDIAPISLLVEQARGLHLLRRGMHTVAREHLELAALTAEALHADLDGAAVGQRFMLDKLDAFDALIELAVDDPAASEERGIAVLRATERARRRRLGDLDVRRNATRLAIRDDAAVSRELDAVYAAMLSPGHTDRDHFRRLGERAAELELRMSRARLDETRADHTATTPAGAPQPTALPNGETVLSWYCVGDRVIAIVIHDGVVDARTLATPRAGVVDAIARLDAQWQHLHADEQLLARHHDRFERACRVVLGELYDMLVAPIAELLPKTAAAPLVVAAHGPLQQVPVHALHDGAHYLVQRFTISTTPSVADFVTRSAMKYTGSGASLVIAASDATTPAITAEGHAVGANLDNVSLHIGEAATSDVLLRSASGAAVIHIACHALFRRDNPMFSSLRLADRSIRANELLDLDLSGALVSLSSCDSARSHAGHGEELVGLMRAVLGAGARTLVASLWPADDLATRHVVDAFYTRLRDSGPAVALREAQLAQLERTSHPYYWAPFVVIGGR